MLNQMPVAEHAVANGTASAIVKSEICGLPVAVRVNKAMVLPPHQPLFFQRGR